MSTGGKTTTTLLDNETLELRVKRLTQAFFDVDGYGGESIFPWPYSPLVNLEAVQKYDPLTVKNRMEQMEGFSKEDLALLYANFAVYGSTPSEEASFLALLHYYALAGYNWNRLLEASDRFKLKIGQSGLANLIFADFTGDSIFGDPVKAIHHQQGSVVTTLESGEVIRSKHIICTIPLHCLGDVNFEPSLPSQFLAARHPNFGGKVHIHLDRKVPSWCGFTSAGAPVDCLMVDRFSDRGGTWMTGFPGGTAWRAGKEVVGNPEEFLDATLKSCLPSDWLEGATDLLWHDWNTDRFSKGQWAAWGAGQLTTDFKSLSESANISQEVTLASADWARGWTGWIDGAMEEGKRVAALVLSYMRKQDSL